MATTTEGAGMNSTEILTVCLNEMFAPMLNKSTPTFYQREPERPVNPPEPKEANLDMAERRLRESLKQLQTSPYWDDFVQILFDEITDDEADQVAINLVQGRISNLSPVSFVMNAVRERAYRVCAERFIKELCE